MKKIVIPVFISLLLLLSFAPNTSADSTAESKSLIPIMTSNTSLTGSVTSSDSYGSFGGFRAFDGNVMYGGSSSWGTQKTTGWLCYEFNAPKIVNKYVLLYNGNQDVSWNLMTQLPSSWSFEGSNDNHEWVVLDTQKNYENWKQGENVFTFENNHDYFFYRINISKNNGATTYHVNLTIHEMQLWGYDSPNNNWQYKAPLLEKKSGVALATVNGKIYSIGGLKNGSSIKTVEEYNPLTNTWIRKNDLNIPRHRASAAVLNGKIYVTGGTSAGSPTTSVEIYDPEKDEWTLGKDLPKKISGHASEILNGKLIVIGGFNYVNNAVTEVFEYDPNTDSWSQKASLNVPRRYIDSAIINGKIYVVGGINDVDGLLNSTEEYDPVLDKWSLKKQMPNKKWGVSVVSLNNELYAIGGYTVSASVSGNSTNKVDIYNPLTDTWSKVAGMNTSRGMAAAVSLDNSIFVAGGSDNNTEFSDFEKYTANQSESPNPNPEPEPIPNPQPSGERAILVITFNTGLEKEFDLSMKEVNDFITWYENRQAGKGTTSSYSIDKHNNNKGPFSARKDYVIFDKILTFEVNEYSTATSATYN